MYNKSILALSLPLFVVACTISTPNTEHKQVAKLPALIQQNNAAQLNDFKPGDALVKTEGKTETVTFTYKAPDFKTQNVVVGDLAFIKLTLVGSGITGTLTNDGNAFIPVAGGTASATISNVPIQAGNIRVVTVQGYDANNVALPSFVGKGYYKSTAGTTTITITINRRQLLTGLVLENLINSGSAQANTVNTVTLQASIDTATGWNGTTFTTDPTRFNVGNLANLITTNGSAPTSTQITTGAAAAAQNVTIHVKSPGGMNICDTLTVSIDDPGSTPQTINVNTASPTTATLMVNPGTWNAKIKKADGTVLGSTQVTVSPTGSVTVTAGQGDSAPNALSLTGVTEATGGGGGFVMSTVAGGGTSSADGVAATSAQMSGVFNPVGVDNAGNVYFVDNGTRLRKVNTAGIVTTLDSSGAQFTGFKVDSTGNIFVPDFNNDHVKKIDSSGSVSIFATGTNDPNALTIDNAGNLYVIEYNATNMKKVDTGGTVTSVVTGLGGQGVAVAYKDDSNIYFTTRGNTVRKTDTAGNVTTVADSSDGVTSAHGMDIDSAGNIYFGDVGNVIKKIDTAGTVTTIAGGGASTADGVVATAANIGGVPWFIDIDSAGNIYTSGQGTGKVVKFGVAAPTCAPAP